MKVKRVSTSLREVENDIMTSFGAKSGDIEAVRNHVEKAVCDTTNLIERERKRMAYDLHDGPAQALSSAILQVDILEDLVASVEATRELESLKAILKQCLHELRASIYALKPHDAANKGLVARVGGYASHFLALTGIEVDCKVVSHELKLPDVIEINAFRVIQEALSNVQKHARTPHVTVTISFTAADVSCAIEDNGSGFDVSECKIDGSGFGGYGLLSMKDRVEQLGGSFDVKSEVSLGTRVSFVIPVPAGQERFLCKNDD